MKFKAYYKNLTPREKESLAERLDTSVCYLSQLVNGHRKPGVKFIMNIEAATNGELKPSDLRVA